MNQLAVSTARVIHGEGTRQNRDRSGWRDTGMRRADNIEGDVNIVLADIAEALRPHCALAGRDLSHLAETVF